MEIEVHGVFIESFGIIENTDEHLPSSDFQNWCEYTEIEWMETI